MRTIDDLSARAERTLRLQIGQQSSRGVEVSGSVDLGRGLRVDANLALLDARYDDFTELVAGALQQWAGNTRRSH